MNTLTELEIDTILQRIAFCAIPIDWKSENPLPGVGERRSKFRGPGPDYVEFTRFENGDDPKHINFALTACEPDEDVIWKTVYQEEKEVKSIVLTKVGGSMDFGTVRTTKRHVAAEMTASIFFALDKTRDKAGLILFSKDQVLDDLQPKAAMTNLYPALESILEANPEPPTAIKQSGDGLSKALSGLPIQKSLVFIISDFMDMSAKDWLELGNAAAYHDVVCIYVQDRRERELPKLPGFLGTIGCIYSLEDSAGNRHIIWNNARARKRYAANFQAHETKIISALEERLCQSVVVSTEEGDAAIPKILDLFSGHC